MKNKFWNNLIDSSNPKSSKRFITLVITGLYIITNIDILFLSNYVIIYSTKGKVEPELLKVLTEIIHWNAMMILGGLGFVTVTSVGNALIEKMKKSGSELISNVINEGVDEVSTDDDPKKQ